MLLMAQEYPTVNPTAIYTTANGEQLTDLEGSQSAPLKAEFYANPENLGNYTPRYEWKIWKDGNEEDLVLHRFDQDIEYTFQGSGSFRVQLYVTFVHGTDTIVYPAEGEENPISVSISESKLEFPNAFSPNGDGYNDILKAKEGWQSIVSFEAAVFNRWGNRIYSWTNLADGWDGKQNGKTVRDGVYFLKVNARGADGRKYNMRKTISVVTGYDDTRNSSGTTEGE